MDTDKIIKLSPSLEDYIEAIYNTISEKHVARAKDLKRKLKVHGASVTGALQALAEKKLINYEPYEVITLTPKGYEIAQIISRRHEILRNLLTNILKLDITEAEKVACGMEHSLTPTVTMRLAAFVDLFEKNPDLKKMLQDSFESFLNKFEDKNLNICIQKEKIQRINSQLKPLEQHEPDDTVKEMSG